MALPVKEPRIQTDEEFVFGSIVSKMRPKGADDLLRVKLRHNDEHTESKTMFVLGMPSDELVFNKLLTSHETMTNDNLSD